MAGHTAGDPLECYTIPIVLQKEPDVDHFGKPIYDQEGKQRFKCGFKIGGGIDQDPARSPQGYPDKGIYVTHVYENGPAFLAGLQVHDKILQVNGHDLTVVTHKKGVDYIKRKPILNMLVYRKGVPQLQKPNPFPFQNYSQNQSQSPYQDSYSDQYSPNPHMQSVQPQFAGRQY